jgi:acylphosphatase
MKRLIARVSGKVQKAGYRSKVVNIARAFGITGSVQNLPDGRVKVIAEGEEADLERFAEALKMRNAIIDVTDLEKEYSNPTGEYEGFYKLVGEDETDSRLDRGVEYLKELVDVTKAGFGDLGRKMDKMLDKQDETTGEVRGLRTDMKGNIDMQLDRIETALREKGILGGPGA